MHLIVLNTGIKVTITRAGYFSLPEGVRVPVPDGSTAGLLTLVVHNSNVHPTDNARRVHVDDPRMSAVAQSLAERRLHTGGAVPSTGVHYCAVVIRELHFLRHIVVVECWTEAEFHRILELLKNGQLLHVLCIL